MQAPFTPMLILPEKDSQTQLSVTEQTHAKPLENSPEPKNQPASATYSNESIPSLPPFFGAAEEIQTSETNICPRFLRELYPFLDDFLREPGKAPFQVVPSTSSNRFSLDYIVMCTLGRMPSSFDADLAEKEISKWSFAAKRKNYDSSNPLALSPISPEVAPVDELPVKMVESTRTRSRSSESAPGSFSLDLKYFHRPGVDSHKSTATKLLRRSAEDTISSDPPGFSSSSYTQTNFKTVARFSKTDHYHNLPSVRNQKLKKIKKDEYPVAQTIIFGNFLKNRTRTLASQCCQDEIKNWSSAGKSAANLTKKRSFHDAFSKALFNVSDDDSLVISQPKVKQR